MNNIIDNVKENHERILKVLDEKYAEMNMKEIETFQMDILHYISNCSEMTTIKEDMSNYQFEMITITSDKDNITQDEFEKAKRALELKFPGSYIRHSSYDYYSNLFVLTVLEALQLSVK